jgi:hypothetical protein
LADFTHFGQQQFAGKPQWQHKKQFLATLDWNLMKQVKLAAVQADATASALIADAVDRFLQKNRPGA